MRASVLYLCSCQFNKSLPTLKKKDNILENYGLSEFDLQNARDKILSQRKYLEKEEFITSNGQIKSLLDVSFSANHSYRYYSQLANKINVLEDLAINNHLVPAFLTMSLDGFYRDLLHGDYTRYDNFRAAKREEIFKSVPDDDILGYVLTKIKNREKLTVKDLYKILLHQNKKFFKSYAFKKLKKENKKYIYIRTVEPHKDGVPHLHMMLFIPEEYIDLFKIHFFKSFPAPRNRALKRDKITKKILPGAHVSFQTDINSASAYVMKYITKSFLDIKSGKELDYLNAWFVKYRVMRCVTSRSVLPQWIYKKLSVLDKDWYYLTDILNSDNNDMHSEWSFENNYFYIYDNWSDREYHYISGQLSLYAHGRLIKRVGKIIEKPYVMTSYDKVPSKWHKNKLVDIPIYQNDKIISFYRNGDIIKYQKHIIDMTDFELYNYYKNYDVDSVSEVGYTHYLAIRNEMIKRDLLTGEIYSLNNFDFDNFLFSD